MSYDADLLNAYRDQLARIRAIWKVIDALDSYHWDLDGPLLMDDLGKAIEDTSSDDIETLYRSKEPPIILPDGPKHADIDSDVAGAMHDDSR